MAPGKTDTKVLIYGGIGKRTAVVFSEHAPVVADGQKSMTALGIGNCWGSP